MNQDQLLDADPEHEVIAHKDTMMNWCPVCGSTGAQCYELVNGWAEEKLAEGTGMFHAGRHLDHPAGGDA